MRPATFMGDGKHLHGAFNLAIDHRERESHQMDAADTRLMFDAESLGHLHYT